MKQFLTADLHFNHKDIIGFSKRPFKNVSHMNERLINNINSCCKKEDILYHLGDFFFNKSSQAELIHKNPEKLIFPKIIYITGNHDKNNSIKNTLQYAVLIFAKRKYLLCHVPPTSPDWTKKMFNLTYVLPHVDCILCGHVHQAWKYKIYKDEYLNIPIINVGIDVWNYRPIKIDKINVLYSKIIKSNGEIK